MSTAPLATYEYTRALQTTLCLYTQLATESADEHTRSQLNGKLLDLLRALKQFGMSGEQFRAAVSPGTHV